MNIDKIKSACKKLIGLHNYMNFCKKDDAAKAEEGDEQNFM